MQGQGQGLRLHFDLSFLTASGYAAGMGRHAGIRQSRARGHRLDPREAASVWEAFLQHLATKSAIEVSKLPGMPSAPTFVKMRRRDPAFDARAAAVTASRRLETSGRKRITAEEWASFLKAAESCCVRTLCQQQGMPSESVVYRKRESDPVFAADLGKTLRVRLKIRLQAALARRFPSGRRAPKPKPKARPVGEAFHTRLNQNELYRAVVAAIPDRFDRVDRDDIAAAMMLAVLEGELALADLQARAKEFISRHWKLFGTIGTISLDAPVVKGESGTIGERLSGEASSYWP